MRLRVRCGGVFWGGVQSRRRRKGRVVVNVMGMLRVLDNLGFQRPICLLPTCQCAGLLKPIVNPYEFAIG